MAEEEEALPGTDRAKAHSELFRGSIDQIRTRTDTTAKGLAAIGTAAIGALGYTKLADFFPDGGPPGARVALILGFVAMVVAVIGLVRRFFRASQSVITNPDVESTVATNGLEEAERGMLELAYEDSAKANGVDSLVALEAKGRVYETEASGETDPAKAKAKNEQAERVFAEVQAAQDRAAAFIVRRRSTYAVFGWQSLLFLVLFVAGWYSTALGSDSLESKRSGEIEVAKSCAEAREKKAIVKDELPSICGTEERQPPGEEASIGKSAADGIAALAEARANCFRIAEQKGENPRYCIPLDLALRAAVTGRL